MGPVFLRFEAANGFLASAITSMLVIKPPVALPPRPAPPPQVGPLFRSAGCISSLLVVCACPLRRRWFSLKKTTLAKKNQNLHVTRPPQ